MRRWVHVGRLPIVPLQELGQFVECCSCASTYNPELLLDTTRAPREDILTRVLRLCAGEVLGTDTALTADDRREAVIVLQRYTNVPYSSRDLDNDVAAAACHPLNEELKPLANHLNEQGRNAVIDATVQLAMRSNHVVQERLGAVNDVARQLGVPCGGTVRVSLERRVERALVIA